MAQIMPFRGIRYAAERVGDLINVMAPPYDVLNAEEVRRLHEQSPLNITHLTRPAGEGNPYEQAARLWRAWRDEGVLREDPEPSLYIYQQKFSDPDTGVSLPERRGLICLLKLEDYKTGKVLPHENTLTSARADRLNLQRATKANLESIYGLYSDPDRAIESLIQEFSDREAGVVEIGEVAGSTHRMERIIDQSAIGAIAELLKDRPVLIADGHHRYETALTYMAENPNNPLAGYLVVTLSAFEDEGLLVLPTHRLVNGVSRDRIEALPTRLAQAGFSVKPVAQAQTPQGKECGFELLLSGGRAYHARIDNPMDFAARLTGPQSLAWKALDVTILHALVLDNLLGIPMDSLATTDRVTYTRHAAQARERVESGEAQAAFLLGRPTVEEIMAVSMAGDKMPQKSTFFYPKLLSGLVMRDLAA